ncbi:MAG: sigma-54-dependent Fis family transcriptional regulator, partial [Nitrospirae bacterium]
GQPGVFIPLGTPLDKAEEMLIMEALEYTNGNRSRAARLLGISVRTIRRKLKRIKEKK